MRKVLLPMSDSEGLGPSISFEERARRLAGSAEKAREELAHSSDENRASRLFIMRYVVFLYIAVVGIMFASNIVGAFYTKDWSSASHSLFELATTMVLPVVTLVLGYYFGREGREPDRR
jgi:hypothetical protein